MKIFIWLLAAFCSAHATAQQLDYTFSAYVGSLRERDLADYSVREFYNWPGGLSLDSVVHGGFSYDTDLGERLDSEFGASFNAVHSFWVASDDNSFFYKQSENSKTTANFYRNGQNWTSLVFRSVEETPGTIYETNVVLYDHGGIEAYGYKLPSFLNVEAYVNAYFVISETDVATNTRSEIYANFTSSMPVAQVPELPIWATLLTGLALCGALTFRGSRNV